MCPPLFQTLEMEEVAFMIASAGNLQLWPDVLDVQQALHDASIDTGTVCVVLGEDQAGPQQVSLPHAFSHIDD